MLVQTKEHTMPSASKNKLYLLLEEMLENNDSDEKLKLLLCQFDASDFMKYPILFDLICHGKVNLLHYLYEIKIPFTYKDESNATVLHAASAISGNLDIVKFLFENNIFTNINACTDENETPFILAIMYEKKDILDYFLKKATPDLSIKTVYGNTAFSLAEKTGNLSIINLLNKTITKD